MIWITPVVTLLMALLRLWKSGKNVPVLDWAYVRINAGMMRRSRYAEWNEGWLNVNVHVGRSFWTGLWYFFPLGLGISCRSNGSRFRRISTSIYASYASENGKNPPTIPSLRAARQVSQRRSHCVHLWAIPIELMRVVLWQTLCLPLLFPSHINYAYIFEIR